MSSTLYSLRTDGDQFRITKITDGDIESSYLCTETECECPAGHRPSCRHRQMIPEMLARGICNTHWFWDFDAHRVVDFNGELKSNIDALQELADLRPQAVTEDDDWVEKAEAKQIGQDAIASVLGKSWRRL